MTFTDDFVFTESSLSSFNEGEQYDRFTERQDPLRRWQVLRRHRIKKRSRLLLRPIQHSFIGLPQVREGDCESSMGRQDRHAVQHEGNVMKCYEVVFTNGGDTYYFPTKGRHKQDAMDEFKRLIVDLGLNVEKIIEVRKV